VTQPTCTCLRLPMGPGQTCNAHQIATVYAWCFSHGQLHAFTANPWCTATWVRVNGSTEEEAVTDKEARFGDARFLHELSGEQQLEVIEIAEQRR